jgi:hypothetical protein
VAAPWTQDCLSRYRQGRFFCDSATYYDRLAATTAVLVSSERSLRAHLMKTISRQSPSLLTLASAALKTPRGEQIRNHDLATCARSLSLHCTWRQVYLMGLFRDDWTDEESLRVALIRVKHRIGPFQEVIE